MWCQDTCPDVVVPCRSSLRKTNCRRWARYVMPAAEEVEMWVSQLRSQVRSEKLRLSCRDVVDAIYSRRPAWDSLVARYKVRLGTSASLWGRCFSHAVFLCAVFRALGFGADHALVAVTCHEGEPFEKALHATVVLYDDAGWHCVDVTKPGPEEAILPIGNLEDLLSTNPYVCMFNDQRWRIAEG